jgi:hypothetical protein
VSIPPHKAQSILIVDGYGVLAFTIFFQAMQIVAGRHLQVVIFISRVQHVEFPPSHRFDRPPSAHSLGFE